MTSLGGESSWWCREEGAGGEGVVLVLLIRGCGKKKRELILHISDLQRLSSRHLCAIAHH